MMRTVARLFLALVAIVLSVCGSYWIAEHYYFDKFFYQKSVSHGYWTKNPHISISAFGKRAKDLVDLDVFIQQQIKPASEAEPHPYTIVLIGDSFVWGSGIRNEDRFAVILERKLNAIASTRVVSLGRPGDGFIDSYSKYRLASQLYAKVDLYIFGIVDNDMVPFRRKSAYDQTFQDLVIASCDRPTLFSDEETINWNGIIDDVHGYYCVFKYLLPLWPREHAVYFDYGRGDIFGNSDQNLQRILSDLKEAGLEIVSSQTTIGQFSRSDGANMRVSPMETHPSAFANRMIAHVLFQYISQQEYYRSAANKKL